MSKKLLATLALLLWSSNALADPIPITGSLLQGTVFSETKAVSWLTENHPWFVASLQGSSLQIYDIPLEIQTSIEELTFRPMEPTFVLAKDILVDSPDSYSGYFINFKFYNKDEVVATGLYSIPEESNRVLAIGILLFVLALLTRRKNDHQ